MDGKTLQQMRNALLERRRVLDTGRERDLAGIAGDEAVGIGYQAEIIDIAQALEQIDREKSLAEQGRREIAAIDRALAKMATGTFGVCEDCDEEIAFKRLLVLPEARLCAKCQSFEERQQGRMRGMPTAAAR